MEKKTCNSFLLLKTNNCKSFVEEKLLSQKLYDLDEKNLTPCF
jgi:hypothetical protein